MGSLQRIKSKAQPKKGAGVGRGAKADSLWRKQFTFNGKHVTLRLGKMSVQAAHDVSKNIDRLIEATRLGVQIPEDLKEWIQTANDSLVKKLNSIGVCKVSVVPTVAKLVKSYLKSKDKVFAESTKAAFVPVENLLNEFFPDRRIASITKADAKDFYEFLINDKNLGENTARRRFGRCREIFADALEDDLITKNPFATRSISVSVGAANKDFVSLHKIIQVIDAIPVDRTEWRLLFAMSRFLGLRIPSEINLMTWPDINRATNTILIRAQKTKSQRLVPIFDGLSKFIQERWDDASERELYVFPTLRHHTNLATTAEKYVNRAGIVSWSVFWNTLRASCETDLMDIYGLRKACRWIGNSPKIAMKNYSLLKKTEYLDEGEKSAEKSAEVEYGIGGKLRETDAKNPIKSSILHTLIAEAGQQLSRKTQANLESILGSAEKSAELHANTRQVRELLVLLARRPSLARSASRRIAKMIHMLQKS